MNFQSNRNPFTFPVLAAVLTLALASGANAAGSHGGGHGNSASIGEPAKAGEATRTIEITMADNSFDPKTIAIEPGETVRFVVINRGEFVHEFNIGTAAMHSGHQKEMMTMMEKGVLEADRINHEMMKHGAGGGMAMAHDDPNSVLLEPGETAEIVWRFNAAANLQFACNVPGHYESGMVGEFEFRKHGKPAS